MKSRVTESCFFVSTFLLVALPAVCDAQFAAVVSPPRVEMTASPGGRVIESLSITNAASSPSRYRFRTADWTFSQDASVTFQDELSLNSCRPWVSIESRDLTAPPGRRLGYRVQVDVPEEASAQECRFALLIEGDDQLVKSAAGVHLPVAGRIAVIFYVLVGDAAPALDVRSTGTREVNGNLLPTLLVRNTGNAHGRLSGFLNGTDAKGADLEFSPSSFPILPGESRYIDLTATNRRGVEAKISFPVTIRGHLEWGDKRIPFEQRFGE